jgi:hypothetical protein
MLPCFDICFPKEFIINILLKLIMANLKYPSGLKVKAPLAWFTAFFGGLGPFILFHYSYALRESYLGFVPRKFRAEDQ